jgi:D-mannonate dehydratase
MIHERYIKEANRIRKEYIDIILQINDREKEINQYKKEIEIIFEKDVEYVKDNNNKQLDIIKSEIRDDLIDIDNKIEKISNTLMPLLVNIESLKKQSADLYLSIKDKYPNLSKEEIQKEIFLNLNY